MGSRISCEVGQHVWRVETDGRGGAVLFACRTCSTSPLGYLVSLEHERNQLVAAVEDLEMQVRRGETR